ncbi:MAG TPA: type II toxin-antitoxin system VapC family toxin [Polyangiaceae bacterium]|nr:type II toxin-antitoxin system VapC family toxin [Polyangiaceae bacterium]
MRYVLDASVAVAALRRSELAHEAARHRCMPLFAGHDEVVVPAIFDLEVISALTRRGAAPRSVALLLTRHFASRVAVTIGPRAVRGVSRVLEKTCLRAADALYVWVALRHELPLVTLDREVLERAPLAGVTATPP